MDFDTEKFIAEVKKRPSIWNSKCTKRSHRQLKQKAWRQLAEVFGVGLPKDKKKYLASSLKKKWRNIRDCFVKAHKSKMAKDNPKHKKFSYLFYDKLLFLADVARRRYSTNADTAQTSATSDANDDDISTDSDKSLSSSSSEPRSKRKKKGDLVGREIIVLNRDKESVADVDEDRLFFLSIVKEFKKIPDHLQIQTKLDLLKIIKDAQIPNQNPSWINSTPDPYPKIENINGNLNTLQVNLSDAEQSPHKQTADSHVGRPLQIIPKDEIDSE